MIRTSTLVAAILLGTIGMRPDGAEAQVPSGRSAVETLRYEPLQFVPPEPARHEIDGVTVLALEDRALPLVTVMALFRGGYGLFDRDWYAPAMGLPALLRYGGTEDLAPDSVEALLEYHAIQTSFQSGGGSIATTVKRLGRRARYGPPALVGSGHGARLRRGRDRSLEGPCPGEREAAGRRPGEPGVRALQPSPLRRPPDRLGAERGRPVVRAGGARPLQVHAPAYRLS